MTLSLQPRPCPALGDSTGRVVGDDEIIRIFRRQHRFEGHLTVIHRHDVMAPLPERPFKQRANRGLVVNNENASRLVGWHVLPIASRPISVLHVRPTPTHGVI